VEICVNAIELVVAPLEFVVHAPCPLCHALLKLRLVAAPQGWIGLLAWLMHQREPLLVRLVMFAQFPPADVEAVAELRARAIHQLPGDRLEAKGISIHLLPATELDRLAVPKVNEAELTPHEVV
jgi:hypothetical protein